MVQLLSDLAPHTQAEVQQLVPNGQLEAILTSLTGPKIEIEGKKYWITEDETADTIVYQLFLC